MPAGVSAYVPLANLTLSSSAVSVTFSSISQSYRDLVLVVSGKSASTTADIYLRFNGNTADYNHWVYATGNGTAANSLTNASTSNGMRTTVSAYMSTSDFIQSTTHLIDYTANKYKTTLSRSDNGSRGTDMFTGIWQNTSAITSIMVRAVTDASGFAAGSTFALYGVSA
jgi:hypothetical protein